MIVIDYSRRFYVVTAWTDGVVQFLERGSAGPDQIRRKSNEQDCVAVRHLDEATFENLFDIVGNVSAGDLIRKWLEMNHWPVTEDAAVLIRRILYIEDCVEYYRDRATRRNPEKALARARRIRERSKHYVDDSVPKKYHYEVATPKKSKRRRFR